MNPGMRATHYVDGVEVKPGAQWQQPAQQLIWRVAARCESVDPPRYSAAVLLNGEEVARAGDHGSIEEAYRSASAILRARMKRLCEG